MVKKKVLLVFLWVLAISLLIFHFYPEKRQVQSSGVSSPTINVSYENFASVLSRSSMIRDLPGKTEVLLNFYNLDSGERKVEKSFVLKNDGIQETSGSSSEVVVWISSKYISGLTNKNLCSTFRNANRAGDLEIATELSSVALAWKFKSMTKYKDCF